MSFDRRITPVRSDLADERLRGRVEAERYTTGTIRRVAASFAPLHRHPSREAPVDTQAIFGEAATVYDEHEGWAWVQLHEDGYVGYLPSDVLREPGPAPTHRVAAIRTFVYPGPSLKLPYQDYLTLNARLAVTGTEGDYARLADGGWVYAPHLAPLDATEPDYVGVAERFLHTPYLWGGKTSLGIDCSGLAQTVLAAAGIKAPRDSDMQERELGTAVEVTPDLGGLARGDLVFWKGHVGLMMDATDFIHATGHSMTVMIEPLSVAEERIRRTSYGPISSIKRL
ncbi:C40 family peptidase [Microvirga sp. TS319]|uniref:C40 family peptidase n=1 Tax=Microvirga sp. TS319 TaxID=3241165 RepID=UPI00351A4BCB